MPEALLLARADLEKVLDFPSVLSVLEEAFHAERRGEWDTPKRIAARTGRGGLLAMPCAGGSPAALAARGESPVASQARDFSSDQGAGPKQYREYFEVQQRRAGGKDPLPTRPDFHHGLLGAKLATTFPGNTALGLPCVSGLYALFDPDTGALQAVLDGGYLTLVRTAAVSALATRLLARQDAASLGVLGAGAQAEFHVRLIATVRPIDRVVVWARRRDRAEALVASLRAREDLRQVASWVVAVEAAEAGGCEIVVSATAASAPVLLGRWLWEGSLVIPIGAHTRATREIDTEAVTRASVIAVETTDTLLEAGDLQIAEEERGDVVRRVVSLGALLDPSRATSRDRRAITIFKSCGVAFEDLAVAALAYRRSTQDGRGVRFAFD